MSKELEHMSDKQIEILGQTMANVEGALASIDPMIASKIRGHQHEVAEANHRAQSNPELLDLRIGRLAVEA